MHTRDMNTAAAIAAMIATAEKMPSTGHTASGDPIVKVVKIVAGHFVQVMLIGWDGQIVVELDKSTEALTVAEAVERIAA